MNRLAARCLAGLMLVLGASLTCAQERPDTLYAAASLSVVLNGLGPAYRQATGRELRVSYAASGVLARQIESGASADAYFPADIEWMEYLDQRHLLADGTRVNLLGNRLVLVAPADSRLELPIARDFPLLKALGGGRLSMGEPASVPAGRYGKVALQRLGVWDSVSARVAFAENVRSALMFVERGEAPLGIVYETDARDDPRVRVVDVFPADSHPDIVYPLALTKRHQPGSAALVTFLRGAVARAAFAKHGFTMR